MADEEGVPAPNPSKPAAATKTAAATTTTKLRSGWSTMTSSTFKLVKFRTRISRKAQ